MRRPLGDEASRGSRDRTQGVRDALELLIKEIGAHGEAHRPRGNAKRPGILLDVDVDGVRCLLIRSDPELPPATLSPREQEIARMVGMGYPNKTIASVLEISTWTVGTHLRRIFTKLGVSSRAAMVARLAQNDVVRELTPARKRRGSH
jgi:DNA-binding CsgD family transcriptional regulator